MTQAGRSWRRLESVLSAHSAPARCREIPLSQGGGWRSRHPVGQSWAVPRSWHPVACSSVIGPAPSAEVSVPS
jgi:hypothetical protein